MAEGAPLLRVYRGNSIEGSNPSFSAINNNKPMFLHGFFILWFSYPSLNPSYLKRLGVSACYMQKLAALAEVLELMKQLRMVTPTSACSSVHRSCHVRFRRLRITFWAEPVRGNQPSMWPQLCVSLSQESQKIGQIYPQDV